MWVRKPQKEIEPIREELRIERFSPKIPLAIALLGTIIATPMIVIFGTKFIKPLEGLENTFEIAVFSYLVCFTISYLSQIAYKRNPFEEGVWHFCEPCQKTYDLGINRCQCGRKLEPFEYYERKET